MLCLKSIASKVLSSVMSIPLPIPHTTAMRSGYTKPRTPLGSLQNSHRMMEGSDILSKNTKIYCAQNLVENNLLVSNQINIPLCRKIPPETIQLIDGRLDVNHPAATEH